MLLAICLEVETIEIIAHVLNNQAERSFIYDRRLSDEFLYKIIYALKDDLYDMYDDANIFFYPISEIEFLNLFLK